MSEEELKKYMKKQSMKTLKGLREIYKDKIIDLEMSDEDASGERTILEAVEFEVMVRELKKTTKRLNKINFQMLVNGCKNRENERPL